MKALVFILVLGNLLFYAFSAGYFGRPGSNPDAGRVEQQVAPERMRLVSRNEPPPVKEVEPPPPAPVAPEPEAPPVVAANVCLRWAQLSPENARQLSTRIGEKFAAFKVVKHMVPGEGNGWWVYIPPLPGKADAEKKAAELRQLGISDYFIVPDDGPNRHAISLGVFSSEKGAQERLAELKGKGVKSARSSARPGKDSVINLEVRGPRSEKEGLLKLASSTLPKVTAQDCK